MWKMWCLSLAAMAMAAVCRADVSLAIMSCNVRYGTAMDGPNAWPHRKDILVETIRRCDPDIMGTQECLEMQAEYIAQQLPDYRWFGIGRDKDGSGEMTAIFYKKTVLSPLESGNFWLSETPEIPGSVSWDSSLTRITTWVKFHHRATGRFFYYFNTHFDHRGEEARAQSAQLLINRFAALDAKTPIILTGDFNAAGGSSRPWSILTEGGMQDAWLAAEKREGPNTTWSGFKAPEPSSDNRIDWILTRGPVTVQYCETVTFSQDGRYPTDHYPVLARVTVTD